MSQEPNKERIREWVRRLRSGDYQQVQEALKKTYLLEGEKKEGFCCLGVACDQFLEENSESDSHWKKYESAFREDSDNFEFIDTEDEGWGEEEWLPKTVAEYFGIKRNPYFSIGDDEYCATDLNDEQGYTFDQIADVLEEKYL